MLIRNLPLIFFVVELAVAFHIRGTSGATRTKGVASIQVIYTVIVSAFIALVATCVIAGMQGSLSVSE
ncbi:hypothetical protein [Levilactobacillus acidifarinae]|uniref:Uncharacterized protein n=1 Tax=Levilactobacillus acidifarinae DSM 19394 = JCM 15949 TaxID=1423715 RepID=A0A0R1LSB1_9LACO|nr:hypothetical protein [Levilactobacillus acidifarinae]KRK95673.1 hypothetical protein FD25_GL000088 [Levilactobacillus acidifarinae DSM 19394]GEO69409.1 hypothetical protein LAC03_13190 [Levilactobacillus acidifarinae]